MLVPVTGDNRSMRSIELAVLIAKASGARVRVIYVPPEGDSPGRTMPQIQAIFERAREIGRHGGVAVRTAIGTTGERELSILSEARRGRYNLIVLGVSRKAGDRLSFGSLADTLLETSDRSLLLFATE